jgi:N-acetylmuramoyl-L-alanine amidase
VVDERTGVTYNWVASGVLLPKRAFVFDPAPLAHSRRARPLLALLAVVSATVVSVVPASGEPEWPDRPTLTGPPPELGTHRDDAAAWTALPDELPPELLRRVSEAYRARRAGRPVAQQTRGAGALSGRVIAVSPGHGIHWTGASWQFQRDVTNGVREDLHTAQLAIDALYVMLERAGATVLHTREPAYGGWRSVIDNDRDAGASPPAPTYVATGAWSTGASPGFEGTYRYATVDAAGGSEARWSFEVPETGEYPVYVHFLASGNRSDAAHYVVEHAFGASGRWLRQSERLVEVAPTVGYPNAPPPSDAATAAADLWHFLGTFPFQAGQRHAVRLLSDGEPTGRVVVADAVRVGAGVGEVRGGDGSTSQRPRWQEAADTFLAWVDVPAWMRVNDVVIRPLYAAYRGVDAYVAIHSNAIAGSATGTSTWTWYPEMWVPQRSWPAGFVEQELPPGTFELASAIHGAIVARVRAHWDASWRDGGHWGADFGELRPLRYGWRNDVEAGLSPAMTIPAVLVEIAYHSEPYDARLLAETRFRHDVARGYLAGLVAHFAGPEAVLPPLPPLAVRARTTPDGLLVQWEDAQDAVAPTAVAERWRVYLSGDGVLFDPDPLGVTERRALLPLSGCQPLYVRVTAVNAGGESLDSAVVGGQAPRAGGARLLFVDGVDREVKTAADPDNLRSYARIYGPGAAGTLPGAGFDITVDEAAAQALADASYDLVLWATGETSTRDVSLTPADQNAIADLLAGGTPLLVSGAELAWHLARSEPADRAFLEAVLGVRYVADDAETTLVDASALGGGPAVRFGDCSADASCVEWPDVLAPTGGGEVVLRYFSDVGGAGTGAAVRSADGLVITAGFPLESVADPVERRELLGLLAAELLDAGLASTGPCPEPPVDPPDPGPDPGPEPAPDAGPADTGDADLGDEGAIDTAGPTDSDGGGDSPLGDDDGTSVRTDTAGCTCGLAEAPLSTAPVGLLVGLLLLRRRRRPKG